MDGIETAPPPSQPDGLKHSDAFLDSLEVLSNRPEPHSPIYAVTAAQAAQLFERYSLEADVDDSVLFPFLHGIEGDNVAQNMFFTRSRDGRPAQVAVPRYRGLVTVSCPAEYAHNGTRREGSLHPSVGSNESSERSSSSESDEPLESQQRHHQQEQSDPSADDGGGPTPTATTIAFADKEDHWILSRQHSSSFSSATSSSSPLSASTTATSLWSSSDNSNQNADCDDQDGRESCAASDLTNSPQPMHARSPSHRLIGSIEPHEIINPTESAFLRPLIPDGISLRNFGTQVPIYATLSDIVLYSPQGATKSVRNLAERIKTAMETKAFERGRCDSLAPGENRAFYSNGLVIYNVFVVTEPFETFQRDHPEWVALDCGGRSTNYTDFMEREKEEMRQLTEATNICENIWLGNTSDVPLVDITGEMTDIDPFDPSDNAHGWDICIECRDDAYFPTPAHLKHAEDHIAKLETVWAAQSTPVTLASPTPVEHRSLSDGETPPMSPDLLGLSTLRVQNASRSSSRDIDMRSRSTSPIPGDRRPVKEVTRGSPPMLNQRPAPHPRSIVHLAFPSSPPSNAQTATQVLNMLAFLSRYADPENYQNFTMPAMMSTPKRRSSLSSSFSNAVSLASTQYHYQYQPQPPTPNSRPLRILLHSMDGYTETSVLALSYLMHARRQSLPEAYLELQIERSRSFFVCPSDMGILRRVETTLNSVDTERKREEKLARREKERAAAAAAGFSSGSSRSRASSVSAANGGSSSNASDSSSSVSSSTGGGGQSDVLGQDVFSKISSWTGPWRSGSLGTAAGSALAKVAESTVATNAAVIPSSPSSQAALGAIGQKFIPPVQRARALTSPVSLPSRRDHSTWFQDPRFDGSFPSRVLPHLYLGNLNHASNAYMLHALGITHVVSVGECALVPPICPMPERGRIPPGTHFPLGPSSNGRGTQEYVSGSGPNGQGSLWIEEREGRIKVLDIKGVSDDGIDSLRPQFVPICEWIEKARQENGKVLVHCRVGVSRSATVTIAYVMKYHGLSLVDAYLLVRSRRLSILIQPNMRLLYNLVGWEIELAREKAEQNGEGLRPPRARLSWPYLAREVHRLNERYLN